MFVVLGLSLFLTLSLFLVIEGDFFITRCGTGSVKTACVYFKFMSIINFRVENKMRRYM